MAAPKPVAGTTFSFSSTTYGCSNISMSAKGPEVDISDLSIAKDADRKYQPSSLRDGDEVSVDLVGNSGPPTIGTKAAVAIGGPNWTYSGTGVCTASNVSGKVGDLISSTASFRVS